MFTHSKPFLTSISLAASLFGAAFPGMAADLPTVQHAGNNTFITGGIGLDESSAIKSAMKDWPLTVLFVQKDGTRAEYVADVRVKVTDQKGRTAIATKSQGPYMLANVQPGTYKVEATLDNRALQQNVEVKQGKPMRLTFLWPA
jgi:Carboxypeptidase regulatory-like domain